MRGFGDRDVEGDLGQTFRNDECYGDSDVERKSASRHFKMIWGKRFGGNLGRFRETMKSRSSEVGIYGFHDCGISRFQDFVISGFMNLETL